MGGIVRVTGNDDQMIKLRKRDIDEIVSNQYISATAVDAGLLLLDKRLNDVGLMQEDRDRITVYPVEICRLILSGEVNYIKPGKFLTILPRNMALSDFDQAKEAIRRGKEAADVDGGHFTLVSNLYCEEGECNVFETFGPFRDEEHLLNSDGKKLLKHLCNRGKNPLTVKCIEVSLQEENECGAIAFGLALQLCFYYHEGGLNTRFIDVRQHLLSCLRNNSLMDFPHLRNSNDKPNESVLFSMII